MLWVPDKALDFSSFLLYNVTVRYNGTMTVTTNERGQQNMFAKEPTMYYENYGMYSPNEIKERTNGRWAMVGLIAGFISYTITGKFFFGIF
jgi:hypothetical protein